MVDSKYENSQHENDVKKTNAQNENAGPFHAIRAFFQYLVTTIFTTMGVEHILHQLYIPVMQGSHVLMDEAPPNHIFYIFTCEHSKGLQNYLICFCLRPF